MQRLNQKAPMDVKNEGHEAFRKKNKMSSNPYPAGTWEFFVWDYGWREEERMARSRSAACMAEEAFKKGKVR